MDGTESTEMGPCESPKGNTTSLGGYTPPVVRLVNNSSLSIGLTLVLSSAATLVNDSTVPIEVGGDFENHSTRPDCFDSADGGFILNGDFQRAFEVGASDDGPALTVDGKDFLIGTLTVASNADVIFKDAFNNDEAGGGPCTEAQYVETLVLEAGAKIKLDHCRLYYETLINQGASITRVGCGEVRHVQDPEAMTADPSGLNKARTLSFVPPGGAVAAGSTEYALRATLDSLHHVNPPYTGGNAADFSSFEGEVRWVGPPAQYVESGASGVPFIAAQLQCTPHYQDWSTVGLLHVFGSAITPSSTYRVQTVAASCAGIEDTCTAISAPLVVSTTRWGDVRSPYNPPDPSVQPDISDVSALVDKFRNAPGAPIKARGVLAGEPGNTFGEITHTVLNVDFGFSHISACVDAFRGVPYPYQIRACP
jgi:hypothetical protein